MTTTRAHGFYLWPKRYDCTRRLIVFWLFWRFSFPRGPR